MFQSRTFSNAAIFRFAIGCAQGAGASLLYWAEDARVWPATDGFIFAPVLVVTLFMPFVLLLGLGNMRWRTLSVWFGCALSFLVGTAIYDVWRDPLGASQFLHIAGLAEFGLSIWPSPQLLIGAATVLFIAQVLITAGDADRRIIASYSKYYEAAWRQGAQLALALVLATVLCLLISLIDEAFKLISVDLFGGRLIRQSVLFLPMPLAFAGVIHITETQPTIIQGVRALTVTMLSWLLPISVLLIFGFLASLQFTGLMTLWNTKVAAQLMLLMAFTLILLINATYQDGELWRRPSRSLRIAGSIGSLMLVPLVGVAGYGLILRVGQYGWTQNRIYALAFIVVEGCFAGGYASAAIPRGTWLKKIETCNIATAFVALLLLLALITPIADPARISVADQIGRLESGRVQPNQFDFVFLRLNSGRYGTEALTNLGERYEGGDSVQIGDRRIGSSATNTPVPPGYSDLVRNIAVYPSGRQLPLTFMVMALSELRGGPGPQFACLQDRSANCDAFLVDLDADGFDEIVLFDGVSGNSAAFKAFPGGNWRHVGSMPSLECRGVVQAMRAGKYKITGSTWREIEVAGRRLHLDIARESECR